MKVLSHRGYWKTNAEKNSLIAFERSFNLGFGTETDVRDFGGTVVIAHDPPTAGQSYLTFDEFCEMYIKAGGRERNLPLALNVKADGITSWVQRSIRKFGIENYFFFDMSIPDSLSYIESSMPVFVRQSEYELIPALYDESAGVWLDSFKTDWFGHSIVSDHCASDKYVCIVSPELHGRNQIPLWDMLRTSSLIVESDLVLLCTDFPEQAQAFFGGTRG